MRASRSFFFFFPIKQLKKIWPPSLDLPLWFFSYFSSVIKIELSFALVACGLFSLDSASSNFF